MPNPFRAVEKIQAGVFGAHTDKGDFTGMERVKLVISGLSDAIKTLGAVTVGPTAALAGMGQVLSGIMGKANPAVMEQFQLAMRDTLAVIGQALVPLFQQVFIPLLRRTGDTLMALGPVTSALADAMAPLVEIIGDLFAGGIKILTNVMEVAIPVIGAVTRIIADMFRTISAFFGLREVGGRPGASVGAAVRSVSHSSIEDAVRSAQRSAFSLGAASQDPAKIATDIKALTDKIYLFLTELPKKIWEFVKQLPQMMWDLMKAGAAAGRELITNPDSPTGRASGVALKGIPGANLGVYAYEFGRNQVKKPGLFGFTSANPF